MGWTDSHLHQFEKDGKNWGVPEWDEFDEFDLIDEDQTKLAKVLKAEGDSMVYQYDFGDDWRHDVVLENIISVNSAVNTPICFGGERRCPPHIAPCVVRSRQETAFHKRDLASEDRRCR